MSNPTPDITCHSAVFTFFGNLPELLVRQYRCGPAVYRFRENPAIKDPIEAMGIPHTEVDMIVANDKFVDFSYRLKDQDNISVYPVFSTIASQSDSIHLAFHPNSPVKFILDVHLGKLARRLRLLGFDCLYRNDLDDAEILRISRDTARVILTRDLGILKHREVKYGYLVRHDLVDDQLRDVILRFGLHGAVRPFLRCLKCNGLMEAVDKAEIADQLEPKTRLYYDEFHRCRGCASLYWRGSHYDKISRWLKQFTDV